MNTTIPCPASTLALLLLAAAVPRLTAATYSAAVTQDQPVVYWHFDEADGNAIQQMPVAAWPLAGENDLVPMAGAGRVSHAEIGSGLTKLGNAAHVTGANFFQATSLRAGKASLDGAWAVEFWVQVQGDNGTDRADYLLNFGNNAPALIYDFKPDQLEVFAGSRSDGGPVFNDQAWHHVLWVYYGDGFDGVADRVDAYFDGVLYQAIGNFFTKRLTPTSVVVGAALANGANGFEGRLDEVAVYDLSHLPDEAAVAAKAAQMATDHQGAAQGAGGASYASVVLADQPFLYWNFDEAEGNALQLAPVTLPAPDNTRNDLLPQGNALRISHQAAASGLQLGNAIDLDGLSSFQIVGGLDVGGAGFVGPWAVELWFQFQADQANRYLLNMGRGGYYNSPALIYGYFGPLLEVFGNGRSGTHGVAVADRNWHHLIVVNYNTAPGAVDPGANVNRIDFILDNVQYKNVGGGFNQPVDFGDWLMFGTATRDHSGGMIGRLDELAIYKLHGFATEEAVEAKALAMAASHYAAAFGSSSVGTITITQHPADAAGDVGGAATFSVAATVTGTSDPLTYQWQRNGVNLDGATGPTYTIPSLSLYDVGTHTYRVRVSAGAAFKFSNPATLTVAEPAPGPATPYSMAVKQDQPLLYWGFDEMTGPAVQQMPVGVVPVTTENDLIPMGAWRVSHEEIGSGLPRLGRTAEFDGNTFFQVDTLRSGQPSLPGPWAVEFWMQALGDNSGERQDYLLNFGPGGGDNSPAFIYDYKPDQLEIFAGSRTDGGPTFNDSQWHHVLWVFYGDGSVGVANKVEVFFDGTRSGNVRNTFTKPLSLSSRLLVGAALTAGQNGFEGRIDEVAIYDLSGLADEAAVSAKVAGLAESHRTAAMTSSGPTYASVVLADGPLLYWNFDEADGHALQQAPIQLPAPVAARNNLLPAAAGRVQHGAVGSGLYLGNAADFDGKSYFQAAQLDVGLPQVAAPWAVEFWMQVRGANPPDLQRQQYLVHFGNNAPAFLYDFKPDQLEMYAGVRTDNGPIVSDETWHHVMWVFYGDGSAGVADRADAFLDGNQVAYVRSDFSRAIHLGSSLLVGAAIPGYNGFHGRLDELALYDLSGLADEAAVAARVEQMVANHRLAATRAPVQPPTLHYSRAGNQLTLSWTGTGFVLEASPELKAGGSWTAVSGGGTSPVVVTIPATGNHYYRLHKP